MDSLTPKNYKKTLHHLCIIFIHVIKKDGLGSHLGFYKNLCITAKA